MITMSFRIDGGDFDSAGLATSRLKEHLARAGVGAPAMRRAMIAAYEAEMNVVIHARTGTLWARLDRGRLDLEIADEGPGIPDVGSALREGWSTASERARQMGFGAGMGLPNIRRNSDLFEIETRVGRGTRIRSTILLDGPGAEGPAGDVPAAAPVPLAVDRARCRRCMRCIEACPAAALRVRRGGPELVDELCIGCAVCAAECGSGVYGIAEKIAGDNDALARVPADAVLVLPRGFLSGFPIENAPPRVLAAMRALGFRDVRLLEEWAGALRAAAGESAHAGGAGRAVLPRIPPLCPAAVALVESRFPSLIPQLGAWLSPAEAAGEEFPLRPVVLVAACPGQYAAACRGSLTGRLTVLSPARLADAVRPLLAAGGDEPPAPEVIAHADPALMAGELAVHGPRHVLRALSAAEAGRLPGVSLLNLFLCEGGCSGSPLLTTDSCLSEQRWRDFEAGRAGGDRRSDDRRSGDRRTDDRRTDDRQSQAAAVARSRPWSQRLGVRLDPDMGKAIETLGRIDALARSLPGRDCGACGSPTCAAFAEDVILERARGATCPHAEERE